MGIGALVFAGQGAQFVGMGRDLAERFPACKALYEQADDILRMPLSTCCFAGPEGELMRSNVCQPAIFVTSAVCLEAFKVARGDVMPAGLAGLSLGEWTALYAAGVLSFADTLKVLEARGQFMQEACEAKAGGMVSIIGLPVDALKAVCEKAGVTMANLNSADQTVLSGPREAIANAEALAKAAGAKRAVVLNVAGAFHSPLMQPAADRLADVLDQVTFAAPRCPVVANVTGWPHGSPEEIKRTMLEQVTGSVRWQSSIEWFMNDGVTRYIELGPGKVLSGLIRRIDAKAATFNIQDSASLDATVTALRAAEQAG